MARLPAHRRRGTFLRSRPAALRCIAELFLAGDAMTERLARALAATRLYGVDRCPKIAGDGEMRLSDALVIERSVSFVGQSASFSGWLLDL